MINKIRRSNIRISVINNQLKLSIPTGADAGELLQEIKDNKQALIAYIQKARNGISNSISQVAVIDELLACDVFHQQKKEYLRFLALGPQAFNMNFVLRFEDVDRALLEKTIRTIFQRHESLRTTYSCVNGKLKQCIHPMKSLDDPVQYFDLSEKDNKEELARELFHEAVNRKFHFEKGPLTDIRLVRVFERESYLSFTVHHVCCDTVSSEILKKEIETLYNSRGQEDVLPPVKLQYRDYGRWVNNFLNSEKGAAARDFYTRKIGASLGGIPEGSYRQILLRELQRASVNANEEPFQQAFGSLVNLYPGKGASFRTCVKESTLNKIKELAIACRSSVNMTLTAAFAAWLHRVTGSNSVRLYLPFSTRDADEFEGIVGWLTSEIILTVPLREEMTVKQLIDEVTAGFLEASPHGFYPHEAILNDLDVPLDELVHGMLNFVRIPGPHLEDFSPAHNENGSGHFNLRCMVYEFDNAVGLSVHYNLAAYSKEKIVEMMDMFINLLDNDFARPHNKIYSPCGL